MYSVPEKVQAQFFPSFNSGIKQLCKNTYVRDVLLENVDTEDYGKINAAISIDNNSEVSIKDYHKLRESIEKTHYGICTNRFDNSNYVGFEFYNSDYCFGCVRVEYPNKWLFWLNQEEPFFEKGEVVPWKNRFSSKAKTIDIKNKFYLSYKEFGVKFLDGLAESPISNDLKKDKVITQTLHDVAKRSCFKSIFESDNRKDINRAPYLCIRNMAEANAIFYNWLLINNKIKDDSKKLVRNKITTALDEVENQVLTAISELQLIRLYDMNAIVNNIMDFFHKYHRHIKSSEAHDEATQKINQTKAILDSCFEAYKVY